MADGGSAGAVIVGGGGVFDAANLPDRAASFQRAGVSGKQLSETGIPVEGPVS